MGDFASALLYGLLARELAHQGLWQAPSPTAPDGALVPLAPKRALVEDIAARHGLLPLLRIGQGIGRLPPDPVLEVLARAAGPHDAVLRWQRLERFLHGRHHVLIEKEGPHHLVLRHAGRWHGDRPSAGEDALILGILAEIARRTGVAGLRVDLLEGEETILDGPDFREPSPGRARTDLWRLRWAEGPRPLPSAPPPPEGPVAERVRALLARDLSRGWTLVVLSRRLALSERTLQRRLRDEGASLTGLLRAVRVAEGARLLAEGGHEPAKAAFVCGFADQAHFTRQFRRQTGLTPAAWRRDFAGEDRA